MNVFWFRRDLRLDDNAGLYHALKEGKEVLPVFIFDSNILNDLEDKHDRRIHFIHNFLNELNIRLTAHGSSLLVKYGNPLDIFKELVNEFQIEKVFTNRDHEPYAVNRDDAVKIFLESRSIAFHTFKDHLIFERKEVMKDDGTPYTVFTPYSKKWKLNLNSESLKSYNPQKYFQYFFQSRNFKIPSLKEIGFSETDLQIPDKNVAEDLLHNYGNTRDFPSIAGTSRMSVHLRFGTVSIRKLAAVAMKQSEKYLNELIWREFYSQILWNFPRVVTEAFRPEYDNIKWRNNEKEFEAWCAGKTGFPIIDAGMHELNATGFMHNRVRMIAASFLTKDLLIDWRWGEAYFAKKLLDFELASNNGGWQWAAGCGCDAAPYFRIFNPTAQAQKFDPTSKYIRKWIPEFDSFEYPAPVVDHATARELALRVYKKGIIK